MKARYIKNTKRLVQNNPALIIIIPGLIITMSLFFMDYKVGAASKDFYVNLTSGAIDVFLLGLVIIAYDKLSERKNRIKRYREEIAGYRPWQESEATYRICGIVRDLNNLNVSDINLSHCYLPTAPLDGVDLHEANLQESYLVGADFHYAFLYGANFFAAKLCSANLHGSYLTGAILILADLRKSNLTGAELTEADLTDADLTGAIVDHKDWLLRLKEKGIVGIDKILNKYCIVEEQGPIFTEYRIREKP
jgi:hypothetical protein